MVSASASAPRPLDGCGSGRGCGSCRDRRWGGADRAWRRRRAVSGGYLRAACRSAYLLMFWSYALASRLRTHPEPSTGDVTSGPSGARRRQHDRMLNGSNGSVWPGRRATGLIGKRGDRGREAPWRSKLGSIKGPLQAPGSRFCRLRTQHMDTGLNGRPIGSVKSEHGPELSGRAPSRTVALPFMVAS